MTDKSCENCIHGKDQGRFSWTCWCAWLGEMVEDEDAEDCEDFQEAAE